MEALRIAVLMIASASLAFPSAILAQETTSPAQQRLAWAQAEIAKNPKRFQAYNQLALAFARRARETSDVNFYAKAHELLDKSLTISPDNPEAMKVRAWVLLGQHEFAKARDLARRLNERWPDDILIYGYLVDANTELGDYKAAEEAAQWMLDIRPGNVPGLTRAAYLRELFGDVEGSVELMEMAYRQTPASESEDRAWILTQLSHLKLQTGQVKEAEGLLQQALSLFPDYHYAQANLAKVRSAQNRPDEAAELLRRRYQNAAHAENAYDLAVALERAGKSAEARALFSEFETKARKESALADNANRELIFYYIDHVSNPSEALRIAALEFERRKDIYTLDAYAWALTASGRTEEARQQIEATLAIGVRDAQLFYHAGVIAERGDDAPAAVRWLKESLDVNPASEFAGAARAAYDRLVKTSARQ